MEVKRGKDSWDGWYVLIHPTLRVLGYVRYTIPPGFRQYDNGHWYVHNKYLEPVKKLMASEGTTEDDPYAILHLRPSASQAIIKAVWREMVKTLHPDVGGDVEEFKKALAAYTKILKQG